MGLESLVIVSWKVRTKRILEVGILGGIGGGWWVVSDGVVLRFSILLCLSEEKSCGFGFVLYVLLRTGREGQGEVLMGM